MLSALCRLDPCLTCRMQPPSVQTFHALSVCSALRSQQMQLVITCCTLCVMKAVLVSAVLFSGAASPQTLDPSLAEANSPASQPGLPAS